VIDTVTPDNPVFVSRLDGHIALDNSLALKLAGEPRRPRTFPRLIARDANGEPTGVLKDAVWAWWSEGAGAVVDENLQRWRPNAGIWGDQARHVRGRRREAHQYMLERGELKTRIYGMRSSYRGKGSARRVSAQRSAVTGCASAAEGFR
jgi:hypothetical protein